MKKKLATVITAAIGVILLLSMSLSLVGCDYSSQEVGTQTKETASKEANLVKFEETVKESAELLDKISEAYYQNWYDTTYSNKFYGDFSIAFSTVEANFPVEFDTIDANNDLIANYYAGCKDIEYGYVVDSAMEAYKAYYTLALAKNSITNGYDVEKAAKKADLLTKIDIEGIIAGIVADKAAEDEAAQIAAAAAQEEAAAKAAEDAKAAEKKEKAEAKAAYKAFVKALNNNIALLTKVSDDFSANWNNVLTADECEKRIADVLVDDKADLDAIAANKTIIDTYIATSADATALKAAIADYTEYYNFVMNKVSPFDTFKAAKEAKLAATVKNLNKLVYKQDLTGSKSLKTLLDTINASYTLIDTISDTNISYLTDAAIAMNYEGSVEIAVEYATKAVAADMKTLDKNVTAIDKAYEGCKALACIDMIDESVNAFKEYKAFALDINSLVGSYNTAKTAKCAAATTAIAKL